MDLEEQYVDLSDIAASIVATLAAGDREDLLEPVGLLRRYECCIECCARIEGLSLPFEEHTAALKEFREDPTGQIKTLTKKLQELYTIIKSKCRLLPAISKIKQPEAKVFWFYYFGEDQQVEFTNTFWPRFHNYVHKVYGYNWAQFNDEIIWMVHDCIRCVLSLKDEDMITAKEFNLFVMRFGPFSDVYARALTVCDCQGQPVPWFFPTTKGSAVKDHDEDDDFAVRFSSRPGHMVLHEFGKTEKKISIENLPQGYVAQLIGWTRPYENISTLICNNWSFEVVSADEDWSALISQSRYQREEVPQSFSTGNSSLKSRGPSNLPKSGAEITTYNGTIALDRQPKYDEPGHESDYSHTSGSESNHRSDHEIEHEIEHETQEFDIPERGRLHSIPEQKAEKHITARDLDLPKARKGRCKSCMTLIYEDGVKAETCMYHIKCFTCTKCHIQLSLYNFKITEYGLFCVPHGEECEKLFAKLTEVSEEQKEKRKRKDEDIFLDEDESDDEDDAESCFSTMSDEFPVASSGQCGVCFEKITNNGVEIEKGVRYHSDCAFCIVCQQELTRDNAIVTDLGPYCTTHGKGKERSGIKDMTEKEAKPSSSRNLRQKGSIFRGRTMSQITMNASDFPSLGSGGQCIQCFKQIQADGGLVADGNKYHRSCFQCLQCSANLSFDLVVMSKLGPLCFTHGNDLLSKEATTFSSGRPRTNSQTMGNQSSKLFAIEIELISEGRCEACSTNIETGIKANGHDYHTQCFSCTTCDEALSYDFVIVNKQLYCGKHDPLLRSNNSDFSDYTHHHKVSDFPSVKSGDCQICSEKIDGNGVQMAECLYHKECLKCLKLGQDTVSFTDAGPTCSGHHQSSSDVQKDISQSKTTFENEAALIIQRCYRNHIVKKDSRLQLEELSQKNVAATKIQAVYRGHQGRGRISQLKTEKTRPRINSSPRFLPRQPIGPQHHRNDAHRKDGFKIVKSGRCSLCMRKIKRNGIAINESHRYHVKCFKCLRCRLPLRPENFVIHDFRPFCLKHSAEESDDSAPSSGDSTPRTSVDMSYEQVQDVFGDEVREVISWTSMQKSEQMKKNGKESSEVEGERGDINNSHSAHPEDQTPQKSNQGTSAGDTKMYERTFATYAGDLTGTIDDAQFRKAVVTLGYHLKKIEFLELWQQLPKAENDQINFESFLHAIVVKMVNVPKIMATGRAFIAKGHVSGIKGMFE